jgi:hypothetical protein
MGHELVSTSCQVSGTSRGSDAPTAPGSTGQPTSTAAPGRVAEAPATPGRHRTP